MLHDSAVSEDHDLVHGVEAVELMGDQQHGATGRGGQKVVHQLGCGDRVEVLGGFVQSTVESNR